MNNFVDSINEPLIPQFEHLQDRINSYPEIWKAENYKYIERISDAGFYFGEFGDGGRCFYCGNILTNIRQHQVFGIFHAARYPTCNFVRSYFKDEEITKAKTEFKDNKSKTSKAVKENFKTLIPELKLSSHMKVKMVEQTLTYMG